MNVAAARGAPRAAVAISICVGATATPWRSSARAGMALARDGDQACRARAAINFGVARAWLALGRFGPAAQAQRNCSGSCAAQAGCSRPRVESGFGSRPWRCARR